MQICRNFFSVPHVVNPPSTALCILICKFLQTPTLGEITNSNFTRLYAFLIRGIASKIAGITKNYYNRVTTRLEKLEYLEMSWNMKNRQICHGNVMEFQENG